MILDELFKVTLGDKRAMAKTTGSGPRRVGEAPLQRVHVKHSNSLPATQSQKEIINVSLQPLSKCWKSISDFESVGYGKSRLRR